MVIKENWIEFRKSVRTLMLTNCVQSDAVAEAVSPAPLYDAGRSAGDHGARCGGDRVKSRLC